MTAMGEVIGLVALVPAMTGLVTGRPPEAAAAQLVVALCNGGTTTIALGGNHSPGPASIPCCAKGYHSRDRRHRFDRKQ